MLTYILRPLTPYVLEFELVYMASCMHEFLEKSKIFLSREGVIISYSESRMVLEGNEGPSGIPVGIALPRRTVDFVLSERTDLNYRYRTHKRFTNSYDMKCFALKVCGALNDLVQAVLMDAGANIDMLSPPMLIYMLPPSNGPPNP